ncbi:MAG: hypothetical protein WCR40_00480, partial [Candidatus Paceibacterota bacterium]
KMKNFNKYTKKISGILIFSILFINLNFLLIPKETKAQYSVNVNSIIDPGAVAFFTDQLTLSTFTLEQYAEATIARVREASIPSVWDMARKMAWEPLMQALAKIVAKAIIQNIVEATVAWINSGFQGNPAYVSDPAKFLLNTGDQVVGEMLFNDPALNFLCEPFQLQVKIALGLGVSQPFYRKIKCTLTGAIRNTENAVEGLVNDLESGNFIELGGWTNWMQSSQPQNNPIGAYLMAKSELDARTQIKKASVTAQLNWGSGALDFQKCKDTTYNVNYDENGEMYEEPAGEREYFGSPTHGLDADGNPSTRITGSGSGITGEQRIETSCETKTPGAIVTDMLGFKATSDSRTLELQSALSNGIDQILNALASQLLKMAMNQLAEGVLGMNDEDGSYKNSLSEQLAQAQANYNTQINAINTSATSTDGQSATLSSYNDLLGTNYSQGFTTLDYSSVAYTSSTTQTTVDMSDPVEKARANAISKINSYGNSEIIYQNTLIDAKNILLDAQDIFISARSCNIQIDNSTTVLRAYLIDSNVITNIDGLDSLNRNLRQIPWSLKRINGLMDISNENIDILDEARTDVNSATSVSLITKAMKEVKSTDFNTDPKTRILDDNKEWLEEVSDIYNTSQCPTSLDQIF